MTVTNITSALRFMCHKKLKKNNKGYRFCL